MNSLPFDAALSLGPRGSVALAPRRSDWDLVVALRRAVHSRAIRGSIGLIHDHHRADFPYSYIERLKAGFDDTLLCGGIAYWLYRVYQQLGFDTFVLNTGATEGPSHVVTCVRVRLGERLIWSVQDAYLHVTYVDPDGVPLCLTDIYTSLATRRFDRIVPSVLPGPAPVSLRGLEEDPGRRRIVTKIAASQGVDVTDPPLELIALEWNYHSYPFDEEPSFYALIEQHFGVAHLALLFAMPLGTSGEPEAAAMVDLATDTRRALTGGRPLAASPGTLVVESD